jgi:HK97 family phage major capsid protein
MPNADRVLILNSGDFCVVGGNQLAKVVAVDGDTATIQPVTAKGLPAGDEVTCPVIDLLPLDTVAHSPEWIGVYAQALEETGNREAAFLAANGREAKDRYIGVKSLDSDSAVVSGWALIFTDKQLPDLKDTFFDPETTPNTLMLDFYKNAPLFIDHGRDLTQQWRPIGQRINTKLYPRGVWLEHLVQRDMFVMPEQYDKVLKDIDTGRYAYSSDSIEHLAKAGWDYRTGALDVWPMVGCSITTQPAEPGLGPITMGSFVEAMKSASAANAPPEITTSPVADNVDTPPLSPESTNGVTQMDQLDKLAEFLGLPTGSSPDDVEAAVESYISDSATGGFPPDFMDAMGLPPGTPPDQAAGALRDHAQKCVAQRAAPQSNASPVNAGAIPTSGDAGSFSMGQPENPTTPPRNYGSLKQSHDSSSVGQKSQPATRNFPYQVSGRADQPREYGTKSFNVNKNEPYYPFAYTFHDMVMARMGQQRAFKSEGFGAKAMSYSTGPAGGYILEQEISDQVLDPLRAEAVVFKAGARQEDLDGVQVKTLPAMLTAPAAYWPGEANSVIGSQPVYRMITLVPKPLAVLVQRPFNFFKNMTANAESQLKRQIVKSMMLEIDRVTLYGEGGAGTSGNGGSRPLGLLNMPGVPTVQLGVNDPTVNNNGRAPTLKDLIGADGSLDDNNIPEGGKRGWVFNARTKRAFTGMTDTFGRPLLRESWGSSDPERELLGYPYYVENQIPNNLTVGTNTDASYAFFADWQYVVVGLTTRVELVLDQTYATQLMQGLLAYVYMDVVIEYPQAAYVMTGVRGA